MSSLCLVSDLRSRCGVAGTNDDAALQTAIDLAGALIDSFCNRTFARATGAQYITHAGSYDYLLPQYPVETLTSMDLKTSEADGWTAITTDDVDYLLENEAGIVTMSNKIGSDDNLIRFTYDGGYIMAGDTDGIYPLPQAVISACIEQAAWQYQHRHHLRLTGTPRGSEATQQTQKTDILESVKLALQPYVRIVI